MINNELQFLVYNTPEEDVSINAVVKDETIWLTQKAMAELFGVQVPAISKHLKKIFAERELIEEVVISKMETTTLHGAIANKTQTRETTFYNLDEKSVSRIFRHTASDGKSYNAESEFEKYRIKQDRLFESEFDRFLLEEKGGGKDE